MTILSVSEFNVVSIAEEQRVGVRDLGNVVNHFFQHLLLDSNDGIGNQVKKRIVRREVFIEFGWPKGIYTIRELAHSVRGSPSLPLYY